MQFIKDHKKLVLIIGFVLVFVFLIGYEARPFGPSAVEYGVTFSAPFAKQLNGDWQANFIAILDDLKVRKLRLSAYWDVEEVKQGTYDFSELDWQMAEAQKRNAEVILAAGLKLPRWPECHIPDWAQGFSKEDREAAILKYLQATIEHYKDSPIVKYWQVENEPFLGFGQDCPKTDPAFLEKEIALVHSLDSRKVIVTDSGELGLWVRASTRGDLFGTTMYFQIQKDGIGQYRYPIGPGFFRFKKRIADLIDGGKPKMVIEFQMEPWNKKQVYETPLSLQMDTFQIAPFDDRISFVEKTGFDTVYIWGVEWFYWLKETQRKPEFWEKAKALFNR